MLFFCVLFSFFVLEEGFSLSALEKGLEFEPFILLSMDFLNSEPGNGFFSHGEG
jgi:hypothetical protein